MTPEARSAIKRYASYITSDASIVGYIRVLHGEDVTLRQVAAIRATLPKGRSQPSYSAGPAIGSPAGRQMYTQTAPEAKACKAMARAMIRGGFVAPVPMAAWRERHGTDGC